jgi:putative inorganic carbon (HCO3(-)) transporter
LGGHGDIGGAMSVQNSLISESIQNPYRKPDRLGVIVVLLSVLLSAIIAVTAGQLGFLSLLVVPAALMFIGAIGKPGLGLVGFLIITYTQLSNVGIIYHGLPSIAQPLAGLLIIVILIRMAIYGERPLGWVRAGLFLLVYTISWLISLLNAENSVAANQAFIGFVKDALGMLIVVYFIQNPASLRRAVWALIVAGIVMGTISVFQYLTSDFSNIYWGFGGWQQQVSGALARHRMTGPYANPNAYAQVLVALAPLALDRIWHERNVWLRILAAWALTVIVLTIFFTFSRGGFLSLIFAIAVLLAQRRFNFVPVIITVIVGIGLIQFLPASYADRINSLVQLVPSSSGQVADTSFRGRLSENTVAWRMFRDNPILGVGLGNYPSYYQDYSRALGIDSRRTGRSPASLYLELIAEQGLVGIFIFVILMVFVFGGLIKARRNFVFAGLRDEAFITSAIFAGMAGYMFEAIFKNSAYSNVFWILVGLALAAIQVAQTAFNELSEEQGTALRRVG